MDAHVRFKAFEGSADHVHLYLSDIGKLYGLAPRVLEFLTEIIPLQKENLVVLDSETKKQLCVSMDCFFKDKDEKVYPNVNLIDQFIKFLVKHGVLTKQKRSTYLLPPIFDFSGDLTLSISYSDSGREMKLTHPRYGSFNQQGS